MPAQRVRIDKTTPQVYRKLIAVSAEVAAAAESIGLRRSLVELVNLRCSQLNGCAFCMDLHAQLGRTAGLTTQQIDVMAGWRDAPDLYDDVEQAALEIAEDGDREQHLLGAHHVSPGDRATRVGGAGCHSTGTSRGIGSSRPSGSSASACASALVQAGVSSGGLAMTLHPAASADATFFAIR